MRLVEPQVFLVGGTALDEEQLLAYLEQIDAADWSTDAPTAAEKLLEVAGRICYRSFRPRLNANVTKVREGNAAYLAHILETRHGSVLEHVTLNFIFLNVSRVFTHELVRHRSGVAISQESLRFVRLTDLACWLPTVIRENSSARAIFTETIAFLEEQQAKLAELYRLDVEGVPFAVKKEVTSAMRRIAPIGLATTIGWSANLRALRWVLQERTSPSAEEEIRLVFAKVAEIVLTQFPNVFADFTSELVNGLPCYTPANPKV